MNSLVFDVELGIGYMIVKCPECSTESKTGTHLTITMSGLKCNICGFINREDSRVLFV